MTKKFILSHFFEPQNSLFSLQPRPLLLAIQAFNWFVSNLLQTLFHLFSVDLSQIIFSIVIYKIGQ